MRSKIKVLKDGVEMNNLEYVSQYPEDRRQFALTIMEKYGDNKWWLSENPKVVGYYQLNENILLVKFSDFHKGVEELLGRPVWTHEFGLDLAGLRHDAQKAWDGLLTDADRDKGITSGFRKLVDTGKPVIWVD